MTEQKPRQCHRDGCDSGAQYSVRLHLNCCAPGIIQPVHMNCSIEVCDAHRDDALVRGYVLSDRNREIIRTALMEQGGHPEPDYLTARIEFVPIGVAIVLARSPASAPGPLCDRSDCAEPATHQVEMKFRRTYQRGRGATVLSSLTNLCVCDKHKALVDKTAFRDVGMVESTREMFRQRGIIDIDFKTFEIGFVPLPEGGARIDPKEWTGDSQPFDLNLKPEPQ